MQDPQRCAAEGWKDGHKSSDGAIQAVVRPKRSEEGWELLSTEQNTTGEGEDRDGGTDGGGKSTAGT